MASETAGSNPNGISPLDQDTDFACSLQEAKIVLDKQVGPCCTLIKENVPRLVMQSMQALAAPKRRFSKLASVARNWVSDRPICGIIYVDLRFYFHAEVVHQLMYSCMRPNFKRHFLRDVSRKTRTYLL
jgi:hypothetical protein